VMRVCIGSTLRCIGSTLRTWALDGGGGDLTVGDSPSCALLHFAKSCWGQTQQSCVCHKLWQPCTTIPLWMLSSGTQPGNVLDIIHLLSIFPIQTWSRNVSRQMTEPKYRNVAFTPCYRQMSKCKQVISPLHIFPPTNHDTKLSQQ